VGVCGGLLFRLWRRRFSGGCRGGFGFSRWLSVPPALSACNAQAGRETFTIHGLGFSATCLDCEFVSVVIEVRYRRLKAGVREMLICQHFQIAPDCKWIDERPGDEAEKSSPVPAAAPTGDDEILLVADQFDGTFAIRNRSLFMLGVSVGGRISELLALRISDVWQNHQPVRDLLFLRDVVKGKETARSTSIPRRGSR